MPTAYRQARLSPHRRLDDGPPLDRLVQAVWLQVGLDLAAGDRPTFRWCFSADFRDFAGVTLPSVDLDAFRFRLLARYWRPARDEGRGARVDLLHSPFAPRQSTRLATKKISSAAATHAPVPSQR